MTVPVAIIIYSYSGTVVARGLVPVSATAWAIASSNESQPPAGAGRVSS